MRVDIVGAGPVGLGLAVQLLDSPSGSPPTVHVWERAPEPYSTPCGEGILTAHLGLVPGVDHARHARAHISQVRIEGPAPPALVLPARAAVLDRPSWIAALVARAEQLGASFHWSTSLTASSVTHLAGDVVAGADGPASRVAQVVGAPRKWIPALQARIPCACAEPDVMTFEWKPEQGLDYAWVFPRGDETSVGLLGTNGPGSRGRLLDLVRRRGLGSRVSLLQAWPIPVGGLRVQRGRYCLVGDASGVAHPLTKAGISPGLLQAHLLSRLILRGEAQGYQRAFRRSPLWPMTPMRAWETLRDRGGGLWNRVPWPPGASFFLTRRNVRGLGLRALVANAHRPSVARDLVQVAFGLRQALRYGW